MHFRDPEITFQSVIHISATEATNLDPTPVIIRGTENFSGVIGDASITVQNIAPANGVVDFVVFVDWDSPLNVVVDITIVAPKPDDVIIGN